MNQLDFFIPIASVVRAKDQQDVMAYPSCSLSKGKRTSEIRFEDSNGSWIEVEGSQKHGMATIWDFDIMLYAIAYIREMKEKGQAKPDTIKFRAHDCLKFIRRGTSKRDYERLRAALKRLHSTSVRTNIRLETYWDPKAQEYVTPEKFQAFHWIERWEEDREWRHRAQGNELISHGFRVQFPGWFVDGIWNERNLLVINPNYFDLKSGYERFLYRIVRKFCGQQDSWDISLRALYERSGTTTSIRNFRRYVKKYVERGNIPDYDLFVFENANGDKRLFTRPWSIAPENQIPPPGRLIATSTD